MLFRFIVLCTLVTSAFTAEDAPKPLNEAQQAVAKAYDVNLVKAQKAYEVYTKEITTAQATVQKELEKIKADLNDTKKFTKLDISARAEAIKEIDGKIAELKKGALGEVVVAKSGGDMLGECKVDIKADIIGKWTIQTSGFSRIVEINPNDLSFSVYSGNDKMKRGTVSFVKNSAVLKWDNNVTTEISLKNHNSGTMKQSDRGEGTIIRTE